MKRPEKRFAGRSTLILFSTICALSGPLLLAAAAQAQPAPKTARSSSPPVELQAKFSFWGGFELRRADGTPVELGIFGGGYETVFGGSEPALSSMRTYRGLTISAMVLRASGLATMATQLGLVAAGQLAFAESTSIVLLVTGAVLSLTGSVLSQAANAYLSDAIQLYNRDLASQGRRGPDSLGRRRGTAAGNHSSHFTVAYRGTF